MDSWVFFVIDLAILAFVVRVDFHLKAIERNTRKPDVDDDEDRPRFE